ncbi:MAG TPA: hypothetical protein VFR94_16170 [Nitrososphaeraceae archaeon]|nr:hypothetical protein [Nitrososphaeraceae archaeon]
MTSKPNTFLLLGLVTFLTIAGTTSAKVAFGQFGGFPFLPTEEKVLPTYVVRIPPGASQQSSPQHYYPPNIAVPAGITLGWVNDDPGQPHTVTSLPTGSLFNSGIIPYGAFFQRTFDQAGEYTYHCEIHPWRTGKVSVNAASEQGNNFVLTSGTGPVLSLAKNDRTLLNVHPTTVTADETTPMTYNIAISDENTNQTVFSRSFFALGNDLQLELIAAPSNNTNTNATTAANATTTRTTTVYGPDFSDPITGAYHVQGDFLKPNTDYNLVVEITAIGSQIPESPIRDTFNLKVMS